MNSNQSANIITSLLHIALGALAARGLITGSEVETLTGALLSIITLAISHDWHGTPPGANPPSTPPSGKIIPVFLLVGTVAGALFLSGCAGVAPGSDPLVVHAEQTLTGAEATFDTFLQLDDQNRALVAAKAPPVHAFAEWLRTPQTFGNTTNTAARWACLVESAELTKEAYKANRVGTNAIQLTASLDALEQALTQTQTQLAAIKAVHN